MKNFVVKFGGFVVDIMAILTLIGLIISTVKVIGAQGLWAGLGVLWAGLVSFIFIFFLIYLVMSINDKLTNVDIDIRNRYQIFLVSEKNFVDFVLSNQTKIKETSDDVSFILEDRRLYRIIAPHSAVTHYICLRKLAFVLLRATSAFRFASAYAKSSRTS